MNNFYYSLWPIFIASTLLGIYPMIPKITRDTVILYSPKYFNCITLLMLISCVTFIIIIKMEKEDHVSSGTFYNSLKKTGAVANFGLFIQLATSLVKTFIVYIVSLFQRNRVVEVIEIINDIDETLTTMGSTIPYKKYFRYQVIRISTSLFFIFFNAISQGINVNRNNFPLSFKMWLMFFLPVLVGHIISVHFAMFVTIVGIRAKLVNKHFELLAGRDMESKQYFKFSLQKNIF